MLIRELYKVSEKNIPLIYIPENERRVIWLISREDLRKSLIYSNSSSISFSFRDIGSISRPSSSNVVIPSM